MQRNGTENPRLGGQTAIAGEKDLYPEINSRINLALRCIEAIGPHDAFPNLTIITPDLTICPTTASRLNHYGLTQDRPWIIYVGGPEERIYGARKMRVDTTRDDMNLIFKMDNSESFVVPYPSNTDDGPFITCSDPSTTKHEEATNPVKIIDVAGRSQIMLGQRGVESHVLLIVRDRRPSKPSYLVTSAPLPNYWDKAFKTPEPKPTAEPLAPPVEPADLPSPDRLVSLHREVLKRINTIVRPITHGEEIYPADVYSPQAIETYESFQKWLQKNNFSENPFKIMFVGSIYQRALRGQVALGEAFGNIFINTAKLLTADNLKLNEIALPSPVRQNYGSYLIDGNRADQINYCRDVMFLSSSNQQLGWGPTRKGEENVLVIIPNPRNKRGESPKFYVASITLPWGWEEVVGQNGEMDEEEVNGDPWEDTDLSRSGGKPVVSDPNLDREERIINAIYQTQRTPKADKPPVISRPAIPTRVTLPTRPDVSAIEKPKTEPKPVAEAYVPPATGKAKILYNVFGNRDEGDFRRRRETTPSLGSGLNLEPAARPISDKEYRAIMETAKQAGNREKGTGQPLTEVERKTREEEAQKYRSKKAQKREALTRRKKQKGRK